jgi:uncharacterized DUF497 family protein
VAPNLEKITGFEWDAGNQTKSVTKHSVERFEAEQVFLNQPLLLLDDLGHSRAEQRFHALGTTDAGRELQVTFTIRGSLLRVISARPMNQKERKAFESQS